MATCKRIKSDPYLTPYTKIHSIWTKNLNIGIEAFKLLEENAGEKLLDVGLGDDLGCGGPRGQDLTPKAQATRAKLND